MAKQISKKKPKARFDVDSKFSPSTRAKPAKDGSVLRSFHEDVQRVYAAIPHLKQLRDEVLFGDVWRREELPPRLRSLVTCAVLAASGRNDELQGHVSRAVSNGVTLKELKGLAVHVAFYAGWPAGLSIGRAILPHLD